MQLLVDKKKRVVGRDKKGRGVEFMYGGEGI